MQKYIKPNHLKTGDLVGVISPSSTIKFFPRRLQRSIEFLESIGLNVLLAKNAKKSFGHNGGTINERVDDIHEMFSNEEVKAIICSTGGLTANAVLPHLDYDLIKSNPKIFCGYSDITVLNLAIYKKAGLITFNGPTMLPTFGEFEGPFKFTLDNFHKTFFSTEPIGILKEPDFFSEENLWWETEDNRKSKLQRASSWKTVNKGSAEGILIGGNLDTLCFLVGTDFLPDFTDSILFLEEEGESTSDIERKLTFLEQTGIFNKIRGLIFARPYNFTTDFQERSLYDILGEFGLKYDIPVIADVDCGHTSPMITMPIGIKVSINAEDKEINILESAVI